MGILKRLTSWWSGGDDSHGEAPETGSFDVEQFIYVKIPGHIEPIERGEIEDRIEPFLRETNLGEISGGGSQLGDARPDGTRPIEFCGIDIDATDRDAALELLRSLLPTLEVPAGTELHYTRQGIRLLDRYAANGWELELARTQLHPGFDI
jgi:hypothetical protein